MGSSKNRLAALSALGLASFVLLVALCLSACGGGEGQAATSEHQASGHGGLRAEDVGPVLATLPYKIRLRPAQPPGPDDGAFRGSARGPKNTLVEFSIGVGPEAFAVPLPGIGTVHAVSNGDAGFAFNSYVSSPGGRFSRPGQWDEAVRMVVEMEERLCRKATGEACPD